MYVVSIYVEEGVAAGSGATSAKNFNSEQEVIERWIQDDDVDETWTW